jgi:hypothetical protein
VFGPRGRRTPNQTRQDRRRIVITVVLVAVVALILGEVIDDIVKSSPGVERRADATWVSAASAVIAQSNIEAGELHAIRSLSTSSSSFDRVTLEVALSELEREASGTQATYAQLGLAAPSPTIGSLMSAVLKDRSEGIKLLASGINLAIGSPPDTSSAMGSLSSAAQHLESADSAYHELTRLVRHRGDDPAMPRSRWITPSANWPAAAVTAYASTLAHAKSLAAAPSLEIVALSIEPAPLRIVGIPASTTTTTPPSTTTTSTSTTTTAPGSTSTTTTSTSTTTTTTTLPAPTTTLQIPPSGAVAVIAATKEIRVIVVVKDVGNTWIDGARVSALVVSAANRSARARQSEASISVPKLAPGSSAYLTLRGLHVPHPATYELLVTAKLRSGAAVRRSVTIDFSG